MIERRDRRRVAVFAVVNLARHVGANLEMALRGANAEFERRFAYTERALASQGRMPRNAALDEMDVMERGEGEREAYDFRHSGTRVKRTSPESMVPLE